MWQFTELFYDNQGAENSGYVTDEFLRDINEQIDGPGRRTAPSAIAHPRGAGRARRGGGGGAGSERPVHAVVPDRREGREPEPFEPESLEIEPFAERLDQALGGVTARRLTRRGGRARALGAAIAGYLTYVHYAGSSRCAPAAARCERVQSSDYAELAGVPVAVLGLVGYVAIGVSLRARRARADGRRVAGARRAGFSGYLTYLELFVIDAICQWCVASAVVMAALAVVLTARMFVE